MRNRIFFTLLFMLLLAPAAARAQTGAAPDVGEHKTEVGAFYTGVNLEDFGETVNGLGGRFGYNFNRHFALDTELSFFPETHLGNSQVGQKMQAFAGVRAGARSRYVGVFAKARPGVMFIGEITSGFNCNSTSFGQTCRPSHNNFALDAGGVLEFYPSPRTIIRLDAGDTIVRIRSATGSLILGSLTPTTDTTHNFQFSVGFGYRF
ncbi:MAG TPA: outer membrane beta-barrel protein [Pyrinomonadaceae bacterium]|nr:outer membrane beta-barrel protein [Pyrinomonadaceae bacterium]